MRNDLPGKAFSCLHPHGKRFPNTAFWKTLFRKNKWICKIPYPLFIPFTLTSFLVAGPALAQTQSIVFQEDFTHCNNAWNSSKAAASTSDALEFSGKAYSSRKCVKVASSSSEGEIRISLPPSGTAPSSISLLLRGARYDKSKNSHIIVHTGESRLDTLRFSSYYKDGDLEPYASNDSMTQAGLDFSSLDSLNVPVLDGPLPAYFRIRIPADDQCYIDRLRVTYHYGNESPDSGCDLPFNLAAEAHPSMPAWLRLSWQESSECARAGKHIRIDSAGKTVKEYLKKAGSPAWTDLTTLSPGGSYTAHIGRACPDGQIRFAPSLPFTFPDIENAPSLEASPDTVFLHGNTGETLHGKICLVGKNMDRNLLVQSTDMDLYCSPSIIDTSDWANDTVRLYLSYTLPHFPTFPAIRVLSEESRDILLEIPVIVQNADHPASRLRILSPAPGEIYQEGNALFSFQTENFIPGENGKIAISLRDSIFYTEELVYKPIWQSPGYYPVEFYLADTGLNPVSGTSDYRTYVIEAAPDTAFPDTVPQRPCPPPENLEVFEIGENSVLTAWVHDAFSFLVEVKDLFGWELQTRVENSEFFTESLQEGTLYQWRVAAVCNEGDTSAWSEGPNFETLRKAGLVDSQTPLRAKIYPNPCRGTCIIESDRPLKASLFSLEGKKLFSRTLQAGEKTIRFSRKGTYVLLLETKEGWMKREKIIVL